MNVGRGEGWKINASMRVIQTMYRFHMDVMWLLAYVLAFVVTQGDRLEVSVHNCLGSEFRCCKAVQGIVMNTIDRSGIEKAVLERLKDKIKSPSACTRCKMCCIVNLPGFPMIAGIVRKCLFGMMWADCEEKWKSCSETLPGPPKKERFYSGLLNHGLPHKIIL